MRKIRSKWRRGERGQAMIEIGLTTVLLFGLIFLITDLAWMLFAWSTLQQAVREGVRIGVTGRNVGGLGYVNDSIRETVRDASLGVMAGADHCSIEISYFNPDTGGASSGTGGDLLVVSVRDYSYNPLSAILKSGNPLSITVSASDIVEACPPGGCAATTNPDEAPCP